MRLGFGIWALWTRGLLVGLMALLLSSCAMDDEASLRDELKNYVYLAQTRRFESKSNCTAAIFDLTSSGVRTSVRRVSNVRSGLRLVKEGRVVAFDVTGATPHEVSEQFMSISLEEGMGMLSSFIGPSMECMDDQYQVDVYYALTSTDTMAIYDPGANAFMLLYKPKQLLFFLRGSA